MSNESVKRKYYEPPFTLYYIEWDDACTLDRWKNLNEAKEWCNKSKFVISECGFLLAEDKVALFFASRFVPEDDYTVAQVGSLHRIPKNWIKKMVKLKVK